MLRVRMIVSWKPCYFRNIHKSFTSISTPTTVLNNECVVSTSIDKAKNEGSIMNILDTYYLSNKEATIPISVMPFNFALNKLHQTHGTLSMLKLFNVMQFELTSMRPDVDSYITVIDCCLSANKWEQALDVWYQMIKSGCKPNSEALNSVLKAMSVGLRWQHALQTLQEIPQKYNFAASERCYSTVINLCAKAARPKEAIELLNEFERTRGVPGSVYMYSGAINACTRSHRQLNESALQASSRLFDQFVEKGGEPNPVMLGCLLNACAVDGDWFESLRLLHSKIAEPNIIAYNSVLKACAKAGEVDLCIGILNGMQVRRESVPVPNVVSFTTVISACAPSGRWREVSALLSQMEELGVSPNGFTYTSAANVMVRGGEWKKALTLLDKISEQSSSIRKVRYAVAMRAWEVSGVADSDDIILELFGKLTGISHDHHLNNKTSISLEQSERPKKRSGDLHCYQLALEACARQGYVSRAFLIIDSMLLHGPAPNDRCFNSVINAYSQHIVKWQKGIEDAEIEELLSILDAMVLHNVPPSTVTINSMMKAISLGSGEMDETLPGIYRTYFESGDSRPWKLIPDKISFSTLLWAIALRTSQGGNPAFTRHLLQQAMYLNIEVDDRFVNGAIHALVQSKEHRAALYILRSLLKHIEPELEVSRLLGINELHSETVPELLVLQKLLQFPHNWSHVVENVDFWTCSMRAVTYEGNHSGTIALELIKQMRTISGVEPTEATISHCVLACCKQAENENTDTSVRNLLLKESIELMHNFLVSPECRHVHYLGLGCIALRKTIQASTLATGADPILSSLFSIQVEQLYLNHPTHRDNL